MKMLKTSYYHYFFLFEFLKLKNAHNRNTLLSIQNADRIKAEIMPCDKRRY